MTADELLAILRRHYLPESRPPAGVFAAEIESPCGKRRADALWMPTTWSGEHALVGHEIKVTRSDVLAELADPTKADAWARYCGRWWLVVAAPALVDGLDVPESWGVMAPPSGRRTRSMTILRPAPKLQPTETGPGFRRVAAWLSHRADSVESELRRQLEWKTRDAERAQQEASQLRQAGASVGPISPTEALVRRIVDRLQGEIRAAGIWRANEVDEDEVVAALADLAKVRDATDSARFALERAVRSVQMTTDGVKRMTTELEKIQLPPLEIEVAS